MYHVGAKKNIHSVIIHILLLSQIIHKIATENDNSSIGTKLFFLNLTNVFDGLECTSNKLHKYILIYTRQTKTVLCSSLEP